MNKLKLLITIFAILIISLAMNSYAQEATESAEEDTTSVEEIEKSLQDRIKKALDENQEQVDETIQLAKQKAFVGQISSLSQNQITIKINPGIQDAEIIAQAVYTNDTTIERSGKEIKPDDLQISDYIIAIGTPDSPTTLNAERIIVDTFETPTTQRLVVSATIKEIDLDEDTILLNNSHSALEDPLDVTSKADLFDSTHSEIELSDLQPNQKVAALIFYNTSKETTILSELVAFPSTEQTPSPTATTTSQCGDGVCQNTACFGQDCPTPETPETCPADCTED